MCVCVCLHSCARTHEGYKSVCTFGVWLSVGRVCIVHVLVQVHGVECIWFMLGRGICACVMFMYACF